MDKNIVRMFEISSLEGHIESYKQITEFIEEYHKTPNKKESNIILNNT